MGCWVMPNRSCAPRHWYYKCNVAFQSIRFCNAPGRKPGLRFQQKILFKLGFLKLTLWIFGTYWIILCCQGCSVYCKMFSSIPGLSLLDAIASAPLSRCDKQMSPAIAKCPLGAESAQFGPNGLKLADGGPYQWGIQVTFWWSGLTQELHLSYLQQRCIITRESWIHWRIWWNLLILWVQRGDAQIPKPLLNIQEDYWPSVVLFIPYTGVYGLQSKNP